MQLYPTRVKKTDLNKHGNYRKQCWVAPKSWISPYCPCYSTSNRYSIIVRAWTNLKYFILQEFSEVILLRHLFMTSGIPTGTGCLWKEYMIWWPQVTMSWSELVQTNWKSSHYIVPNFHTSGRRLDVPLISSLIGLNYDSSNLVEVAEEGFC